MAENELTLRYFSLAHGAPGARFVPLLHVPSNATIIDIIIMIAADLQQQPSDIVLWKPREFLPKNDPARFRSLLKQHGYDLSKFCDELDRESCVLEIFGAGVRPDTITTLVAEVPGPTEQKTADTAEHSNEHSQLTPRISGFRKVRQSGPSGSPSRNCQPKQYYEHQCGDNPILDGRYGSKPTTVAPPVEDFHYAFAQFKAQCSDEQLPVPEEFVRKVDEVTIAVSKIKVDGELSPEANTRSLLSNLFSATFGQLDNSTKTSADNVYSYSRVRQPLGLAALAIVEEKAELGSSGDGSVQGSFSYMQHWLDQGQRGLLDACFGPSFVITVSGPYIIICGAIFTSRVIVHRLTDYIWLANSRSNDDANVHRIARIFYALGNALVRLQEFYKQLESPASDVDDVARYFPLATTYRDDENIVRFRYTGYLNDVAEACVVYRAVECAEPREIVVKFVEHYGADAHRLLASHGLAPKLLYCGNVWLEGPEAEGCGSRRMVVMEYIEGETGHAMLSASGKRALPESVRRAIRRAVKLLHDNGMVHGDVRLVNVLIAKPTGAGEDSDDMEKRVRIVDFDWAGIQGEVRYPLFLSKAIRWPAGVDDYALIQFEHDDEMVDRLD
ncbi:hypothetical protein ONZ51_g5275 [Trametes cubensis]|uniref:Protein kinase domain-containing protein n=1 Tax=Trametes cubensis TaxID=1111947 RepID=A0AAD7TUB2_9APHY|nr:hypothetical protein ONZ51_g5275 [Trametes cubensis]